MINWKVRFQNRNWVIAFISQLLIVTQIILAGLNSLGVTDFQLTDAIKDWILMFANAVFVLLSMLGLVQDPTTKGYRDSVRAMNYKKPN
ncbi:phage holin [Neobacillus kokaensis]|uniref:Phage holin n=1 Tax=Neobacillus kokaensis TaxID=2759023 RepID=A0ABQ3MY55_9BACI|nr:phage holin [Neobacillus kokaensis]GHH96841.1 phage holin [Neobacillus kokaensis]